MASGGSVQTARSPTTTAEVHQHVSLRMLRLLAGDTEKALEPIQAKLWLPIENSWPAIVSVP